MSPRQSRPGGRCPPVGSILTTASAQVLAPMRVLLLAGILSGQSTDALVDEGREVPSIPLLQRWQSPVAARDGAAAEACTTPSLPAGNVVFPCLDHGVVHGQFFPGHLPAVLALDWTEQAPQVAGAPLPNLPPPQEWAKRACNAANSSSQASGQPGCCSTNSMVVQDHRLPSFQSSEAVVLGSSFVRATRLGLVYESVSPPVDASGGAVYPSTSSTSAP